MHPPANPLAWRIGLVGYGEVGQILAEDLRSRGMGRIAACDVKFGTADQGPLVAHATAHGVAISAGHAALAAEADCVISAVTARQGSYFFQHVVQHGRRRAEEMREVSVTVREAGLDPWSAAGTA